MKVLVDKKPLEYLLDRSADDGLDDRDRALARAIAATSLRRKGQIDKIVSRFMKKPLGKRGGKAPFILLTGATQILFMDVPDHAAVSLAMNIAKRDERAKHFFRLINAVLRQIAREKEEILSALNPMDILPDWLLKNWSRAYGRDICLQMAKALSHEPYLDVRLKDNCSSTQWAEKLEGHVLSNGSIRLAHAGNVQKLAGFDEGLWWVQDFSASLAATILGDVGNKNIADLCAAPGGKSALLADRGGKVTAVDISGLRLETLKENLNRLSLPVTSCKQDILKWESEECFDHILLDAPCSATGTIRKHPDIFWLKNSDSLETLIPLQRKLLEKATALLKTGGRLVFCTCSLQKEEGEDVIDFIRDKALPLKFLPISLKEVGGLSDLLNDNGTVRCRPDISPLVNKQKELDNPNLTGMDGFFIARFEKI